MRGPCRRRVPLRQQWMRDPYPRRCGVRHKQTMKGGVRTHRWYFQGFFQKFRVVVLIRNHTATIHEPYIFIVLLFHMISFKISIGYEDWSEDKSINK